jgi:predicted RNase H-like HicB family nuclease
MSVIEFAVTFDAELAADTEAGGYVAYSPSFGVMSQGETLDEARENLVEAVHLFLESCYERGTLDQALKELGFTVADESEFTAEFTEPVSVRLPMVSDAAPVAG